MEIIFTNIKLLVRKPFFWLGLTLSLIIIILLIKLAFSISASQRTADSILKIEDKNGNTSIDWKNQEIKSVFKKKLWLENQLALSKDDSMSLGINLEDSVVQIQLKGLPLTMSKIISFQPENFLSEIDPSNYAKFFGKPMNIINGICNLDKKPIRKKKVTEGSDEEVISDSIVTKRFYWEFVTDKNIRIVINGCENINDSIIKQPSFLGDIIKFRLKRKSNNQQNEEFHPTLFIWMNDNEAKAIYRALPKKTRLSIQN